MYTRFVWDSQHPRVDAEAGIFDAYWKIRDRFYAVGDAGSNVHRKRDLSWRRDRRKWLALDAAVREFGSLRSPFRESKTIHRQGQDALFWFIDDAGYVGHAKGTLLLTARAVAHELSKWDVEIRELHCRHPGEILWQDHDQVLAKPIGTVPRAFRG